jgi:peptidoglycan-associated lipoprotein
MPRSTAATGAGVLILLTAMTLAACSRSQPNSFGLNLPPPNSFNSTAGTVGSSNGSENGPILPGSAREFAARVGDTVYFSTDSSEVSADGENTLRAQARWLAQYPQYTVVIEGHADERGTREYNIALGAQRAAAVRHFLGQQGVHPARIRTISYGKERPVAVCPDISCWRQNRRTITVLDGRPAVASR